MAVGEGDGEGVSLTQRLSQALRACRSSCSTFSSSASRSWRHRSKSLACFLRSSSFCSLTVRYLYTQHGTLTILLTHAAQLQSLLSVSTASYQGSWIHTTHVAKYDVSLCLVNRPSLRPSTPQLFKVKRRHLTGTRLSQLQTPSYAKAVSVLSN
jgi:hypothetical protein